MSFGHALYYPHINLTNKNWIKHALLFWENISRIVPRSVEPSDNEDIIRIKLESDFIKDYNPKPWDTSQAFSEFTNELRPILESDHFFNNRYFELSGRRGHYNRDYREKRAFFSELARSTGTYIHIEKINPDLIRYLFDIGIAVPGEHEWESWIKIDNEIGLLYMTYFAKSISKNKSLPIVTDIEKSFSASLHFESSINSDYKDQFEYKLGNLVIDSIVPKNINDVPLDKILEIRNKYDGERTSFFNEISNLSNSIAGIDNADALKDALNLHSKLIIKETKDLEKLYNSNKIETVTKSLSISVPTTIASFTEYVPDAAKPIVLAGGVMFGMISAANSVKKEKLELQKEPKSYLLNLKSELSDQNIFNRLNDTIKGIRKW
ncbi:DUF6236 family protein [Elizabethkingia anophelis]|uniref:DUF6236 family protein n=1 Tax=Elizabethkingia anophelis TaxID=1117645 RepID=UPI0013706CD9|nr:DUF6236 family protein [Elizabethkingia anophelis]MCT4123975.1 hypothetical protein [Elizabethkingia anophelis]MDV3950914.1 hypothetical protein [Elizabethkingia anophelis]MYY42950.1 hypothetical protein [Elizabethkingia anophelis]